MLAAMFSGRHYLARDPVSGRILIDRDPKYFGFVLNYLRNGCTLPANLPTDEAELGRVMEEFDYFCIDAFETPRGSLPVTAHSQARSMVGALSCGQYETITLEPTCSPPPGVVMQHWTEQCGMTERLAAIVHGWDGDSSVKIWVSVWDLVTGAAHSLPFEVRWGDEGSKDASPDHMAVCGDSIALLCGREVLVYVLTHEGLELEWKWTVPEPTPDPHNNDPGLLGPLAISDKYVVTGDTGTFVVVWSRETGEMLLFKEHDDSRWEEERALYFTSLHLSGPYLFLAYSSSSYETLLVMDLELLGAPLATPVSIPGRLVCVQPSEVGDQFTVLWKHENCDSYKTPYLFASVYKTGEWDEPVRTVLVSSDLSEKVADAGISRGTVYFREYCFGEEDDADKDWGLRICDLSSRAQMVFDLRKPLGFRPVVFKEGNYYLGLHLSKYAAFGNRLFLVYEDIGREWEPDVFKINKAFRPTTFRLVTLK